MGHIVNATSFRLDTVIKRASVSASLASKIFHKNLIIIKFLSIFFTKYSSPINRKNTKDVSLGANSFIIPNCWINTSIMYSNAVILREKKGALTLKINLFDSFIYGELVKSGKTSKRLLLMRDRFRKGQRPLLFKHFKYGTKTKKLTKKFRLKRSKTRYFISKFLSWRRRIRSNKRRHYLYLLPNNKRPTTNAYRVNKWRYPNLHRRFPKYIPRRIPQNAPVRRARDKYYNKLPKFKLLRLFPLVRYNRLRARTPRFLLKNRFKLLKVFLCMFHQEKHSWKQQYFYIIIFRKLLLSLMRLPKIKSKYKYFKIMNLLRLKEFSYKHLNLFFFRKLFRKRFLIYRTAYLGISKAIRAFENPHCINISFSALNVQYVTAAHVCNFITMKLSQYFRLPTILGPILGSLRRSRGIIGFRILVVGRLTRRERAAQILRQRGGIPLARKSKYIDYAADYQIMRFGVVGVKVWLQFKSVRPHIYSFQFFQKA